MAASTSTDAAPLRARRLDVQGLRAVASLLVASYHIWIGTISGGVDVFFVLGGFLLASSIMGEIERSGRIAVGGGVLRLLGRQMPLVGLVVGIAGAVALAVRPAGFQRDTALEMLAASSFWQNVRLAASSTDYVDAGLDKSFVQHLWAMGVQLQASVAMLVVAAIVALLVRRLGRLGMRAALALAFAAMAVASGAWAAASLAIDPVTAYYDTGARLWELALGGVAALVLPRIRLGAIARTVLAFAGLALVLGAGLLPSSWPYPGPVALVPVVGALLLLVTGAGGSGIVRTALSWRPLVWLGGISFGIYLWHWPILWTLAQLDPRPIGLLRGGAVIVAAVLLAWGSVTLLRALGRVQWRSLPPTAASMPATALCAIALLIAPVPATTVTVGDAEISVASSTDDLQARVQAAVAEPSSIADGLEVWDAGRAAGWNQGCLQVDPGNRDDCRFVPEGMGDGDALESVWVVGDSHSLAFASSVREALGDDAIVQMMTYAQCPWFDRSVISTWLDDERASECVAHTDWVIDEAVAAPPELFVLSFGAWGPATSLDDDELELLLASAADRVATLVAADIPVLWLDTPPPTRTWDDCMAAQRRGSTSGCATAIAEESLEVRRALSSALADAGATIEDTLPWFCDVTTLQCPMVVDGVPVYADHAHIGEAEALVLSHLVRAAMQRAITTS